MTRKQLQAALDKLDRSISVAENKFNQKWAAKLDRMDWYERALEMHDLSQNTSTPLDPVQCLLIVDKDQSTDKYGYEEEIERMRASKQGKNA